MIRKITHDFFRRGKSGKFPDRFADVASQLLYMVMPDKAKSHVIMYTSCLASYNQ
jgi:hypothetical protein